MSPSRILLVTLVSFAMVPVAAAQEGSVTIDFDDPATAVMSAQATFAGQMAMQTRHGIDQNDQGGNQDGQVTQDEVDAFETWILGFFESFGGEEASPTGSLTMDGKGPTEFRAKTFDVRDATGPASSDAPITVRMEFEMKFPVEAGDRHTLKMEADEDQGSEEEDPEGGGGFGDFDIKSATLKAPDGYIIDSATGLPEGASVSGNKKSINFGSSLQPEGDMVIVFVRGGAAASGPALALVVLALASVSLLRRR